MSTLSEELSLLIKIGKLSVKVFDQIKETTLNQKSFYEFVQKDQILKNEFSSSRDFSRYLRRMHQEYGNEFRKRVNCIIDDSDYRNYKYSFLRPSKHDLGVCATYDYCESSNRDSQRIYFAKNGERLRSSQEMIIYNSLLTQEAFHICYESPIKFLDEVNRHPDFRIENKRTNKIYFWEHFGVTNNESYKDDMEKRIRWYQSQGDVIATKEKGNVIMTYYDDDAGLMFQIRKNIQLMLD